MKVPFSDLVDSTTFSARIDQDLCEVIAAYQTCVAYFCSE
jgi:hypothetical protein